MMLRRKSKNVRAVFSLILYLQTAMSEVIFQPIDKTIRGYQIIPLDGREFERLDQLAEVIYTILSDENTLKFIPEKRLQSVSGAKEWLYLNVLNFHARRNYLHLITARHTGTILGMVDVLSPALIKENYLLHEYPFFIEFYLRSEVQDENIMSDILPDIIHLLNRQGIKQVAAVADRTNLAASRVLIKSGFQNAGIFDLTKDLFYSSIIQGSTLHTLVCNL